MPKFQRGNRGGPGRPRGSLSGRSQALSILDKIFAKESNIKKLEKGLQDEFDSDPVKFFKSFGMPLIPKEMWIHEYDESSNHEIQEKLSKLSTEDLVRLAHPENPEKYMLNDSQILKL